MISDSSQLSMLTEKRRKVSGLPPNEREAVSLRIL
jgi:hypothetical protein